MADIWTDSVIDAAIENGIAISEAPHFVKLAQLAEKSAESEAFADGVADTLNHKPMLTQETVKPEHTPYTQDRVLDKAAALLPFDNDAFIEGFATKCAEHRLSPAEVEATMAVYLQKEFGADKVAQDADAPDQEPQQGGIEVASGPGTLDRVGLGVASGLGTLARGGLGAASGLGLHELFKKRNIRTVTEQEKQQRNRMLALLLGGGAGLIAPAIAGAGGK